MRTHREVVSFVRRSARMNDSQRKNWDAYRDRFVVDVPQRETSTSIATDAHIDWDEQFGRHAPLIVELGCGIGESLVAMAAQRPEINFVAFEVFEPAVAQTMGRSVRHGVGNIRIVIADAVAGLNQLFADGSIDEILTFFPDPWHKKKHHKRRLVNAEFGHVVARKLVPGGAWRLATDWVDYAEWMRAELDDHPALVNEHEGWAPRLADRPLTKFEKRGLAEGREIFDLTYRRRP